MAAGPHVLISGAEQNLFLKSIPMRHEENHIIGTIRQSIVRFNNNNTQLIPSSVVGLCSEMGPGDCETNDFLWWGRCARYAPVPQSHSTSKDPAAAPPFQEHLRCQRKIPRKTNGVAHCFVHLQARCHLRRTQRDAPWPRPDERKALAQPHPRPPPHPWSRAVGLPPSWPGSSPHPGLVSTPACPPLWPGPHPSLAPTPAWPPPQPGPHPSPLGPPLTLAPARDPTGAAAAWPHPSPGSTCCGGLALTPPLASHPRAPQWQHGPHPGPGSTGVQRRGPHPHPGLAAPGPAGVLTPADGPASPTRNASRPSTINWPRLVPTSHTYTTTPTTGKSTLWPEPDANPQPNPRSSACSLSNVFTVKLTISIPNSQRLRARTVFTRVQDALVFP